MEWEPFEWNFSALHEGGCRCLCDAPLFIFVEDDSIPRLRKAGIWEEMGINQARAVDRGKRSDSGRDQFGSLWMSVRSHCTSPRVGSNTGYRPVIRILQIVLKIYYLRILQKSELEVILPGRNQRHEEVRR